MRKFVRKDGNSFMIRLDNEDMQVYDLKEGDIVDIEICKIINKNRKVKDNERINE